MSLFAAQERLAELSQRETELLGELSRFRRVFGSEWVESVLAHGEDTFVQLPFSFHAKETSQ